jgi:hypothetical protein
VGTIVTVIVKIAAYVIIAAFNVESASTRIDWHGGWVMLVVGWAVKCERQGFI